MAASPFRYYGRLMMAIVVMIAMVGLLGNRVEAQCNCTNGFVHLYYQIQCFTLPYTNAAVRKALNLGERVDITCQANMTDGLWDYLPSPYYNCYVPHTEPGPSNPGWQTGCPGRCSNLPCCASYPCT